MVIFIPLASIIERKRLLIFIPYFFPQGLFFGIYGLESKIHSGHQVSCDVPGVEKDRRELHV